MAKKRKPKLPKKIVPQEEEAPLKKEEEEDTEANTEEDQLLKRRRTALPDRQIEGEDDEDYENPPAEWMEENLCFCCAHCDCAVWGDCDKEKMDLEEVYPYICASAQALPHRTCCHNADKSDRAWASPCEKAQLLFSDVLMGEKAMEELQLRQPPLEWIDKKVIKSSYNTARSQQSALYNADGLESE